MDGRGQMLLLSALAVCLCLVLLTACLASIRSAETPAEPSLEKDALDNVVWAMETGMKQAAGETGASQWEQRCFLADDYENLTDRLIEEATCDLQKRGIASSFAYDEALAGAFLNDSGIEGVEGSRGVLLKKEGTIARIWGCAYDVTLTDGSAQYSIKRVAVWR